MLVALIEWSIGGAIVILLNIRWFRDSLSFYSAIVSLLFLICCYCIVVCEYSVYLAITPILVAFIYQYFLIGELLFEFPKWPNLFYELLVYSGIVSFFMLFYLFFFDFEPSFPHEDYLIYGRIAYYNGLLGAENIRGFQNVFNAAGSRDVYHYLELWLADLVARVGGISRVEALIFVVYPAIAYVAFTGIRSLLDGVSSLYAFLILVLCLVVTVPYDAVNSLLHLRLPISGLGGLFLNMKLLLVLPIVLVVLHIIRAKDWNPWLLCLSCFFYIPVTPVVLPSVAIWWFIRNRLRFDRRLFVILGFGLIMAGYMYSITDLSGDIGMYDVDSVRALYKILFVGLSIPAMFYSVIFLFRYRFSGLDSKGLLLFLIIAECISLALWFLFRGNIDANQFFSMFFSPLLSLLLAIALFELLKAKRILTAGGLCLVFCSAFIFRFKETKFITIRKDIGSALQDIPYAAKVLVIPDTLYVENVFLHNEAMYNPMNVASVVREDIHWINIAGAFSPRFDISNSVRMAMVERYRSRSPYYRYCGEFKDDDRKCLVRFMMENDISILATVHNLKAFDGWQFVSRVMGYNLYKIKAL